MGKTIKGIKALAQGGSYNVDADGNDILQYPVYKDDRQAYIRNAITAAVLGKSALPTAQDWVESGFDSLSAKETKVYQELTETGADQKDTFELLQELGNLSRFKGTEKKMGQQEVLAESKLTEEEKQVVMRLILGEELVTDSGNPSRYAKFLSATDRGLSVDRYMDLYVAGADIDKFLELTDEGMNAENAADLTLEMGKLEPIEGEKRVSKVQQWLTCVTMYKHNMANQMAALAMYMTPEQFEKVEAANEYGVTPAVYVDLQDILPLFDSDKNGNYTQTEVQEAIESMDISNQEKAVLWQIVTGSKKGYKNPFDKTIGQKIADGLKSE